MRQNHLQESFVKIDQAEYCRVNKEGAELLSPVWYHQVV